MLKTVALQNLLPLVLTAALLSSASGQEDTGPDVLLKKISALAVQGKALTACSAAYDYYCRNGFADRADRLKPRLLKLQQDFLRGRGSEFLLYRVPRGSHLTAVATLFGVTHSFLVKVNGLPSAGKLQAGAEIKTVTGPFSLKVFLKERRAVVYLGEARIKEYAVAVGSETTPTPAGKYAVQQKVANPPYDHNGEHYDGGDPLNPAGTRWIRLKGSLGIHGTCDPDSIGKAASEGCIRFRNEDIEEVFDFLVPGSPVIVTEAMPKNTDVASSKGVE
ncbi:MAG: L,D-transpeptidase [Planctomycetes bacterium]|nr:L,D-transpeptidase [Planctomycetota bacterium]